MGGDVWSKSVDILSKNGTIVFCATTIEEPGNVDIGRAFSNQLNILGSYGGTVNDLKEVIRHVQNKFFKPVIDSTFSLDCVPEALKKLNSRASLGKILIAVH